jgi:peptidoglycan biosynthesis protein MviN/MurJ (putative lipid II flippase)
VNYLGQAGRRIPIVLTALAINVVVVLVLLPVIGVVGAAIGATVAYAVYVPAHFRICQRELKFPIRPLALTLVRALLAAAVMGAVLFVTGPGTLTFVEWLLAGTLGVLAFAAALWLSGEISHGEIQRGRRAMFARLSRLASSVLR